jgi:hypothetical protein
MTKMYEIPNQVPPHSVFWICGFRFVCFSQFVSDFEIRISDLLRQLLAQTFLSLQVGAKMLGIRPRSVRV